MSNDIVKLRATKDGPWMWANKDALRILRDYAGESIDRAISARSVYFALCELASDQGTPRFSVPKSLISFKSAVAPRTIQRVLPMLEELKLINVIHTNGIQRPNTYEILSVLSSSNIQGASAGHQGATSGQDLKLNDLADIKKEKKETDTKEGEKEPPSLISFPWKSWADLDQSFKAGFEERFKLDWLQYTFSSIRGRKISFDDRCTFSDWYDVLRGEIDASVAKQIAIDPDHSPLLLRRSSKNEAPPVGWESVLVGTQYGPGGLFETTFWDRLPPDVQKHIRDRLSPHSDDQTGITA